MSDDEVADRLDADPRVQPHPGLARMGAAAFAYATVLLDDDDNLTRLGNPTGAARAALRERLEALLAETGP